MKRRSVKAESRIISSPPETLSPCFLHEQLAKMRANFFRRGHSKVRLCGLLYCPARLVYLSAVVSVQALENEDVRHSMPIAIMGDYLSPSHQRQVCSSLDRVYDFILVGSEEIKSILARRGCLITPIARCCARQWSLSRRARCAYASA